MGPDLPETKGLPFRALEQTMVRVPQELMWHSLGEHGEGVPAQVLALL